MRYPLAAFVLLLAACGELTTTGDPATTPASTAPATVVSSIAGPVTELSRAWPCGYGFWLSDADQTVALRFGYTNHDAAVQGEVPETVTLPDPEWTAELLFGRDLYANWCDDVIEVGEPEPVVDGVWEVTSGLIRFIEWPPGGEIGPATAELLGVSAVGPDGREVEFGAMTVTNECWGCFAG